VQSVLDEKICKRELPMSIFSIEVSSVRELFANQARLLAARAERGVPLDLHSLKSFLVLAAQIVADERAK
jgi:hypothetical protein